MHNTEYISLINTNRDVELITRLTQEPSIRTVSLSSSQPSRAEITALQSAPFGTEIGSSHGVVAYSNENTQYISHETNECSGIFSGMKWQCVEYARRFLQKILGMTFESVYGAKDIWFLNHATPLDDGTPIPFEAVPNGSSKALPNIGDLIIYPVSESSPYGHVAAVVKVDCGLVYLAEQNWNNCIWPGDGSYSRALQIEKNSKGFYELNDHCGLEILGWKTTNLYRQLCQIPDS